VNSFGSAGLQFLLCDAREVNANRARFRRAALPDLLRANHFYCPSGRWPFRGWVLLPRSEYAQLDPYSTSLQLSIGDPSAPDNVGVLRNLTVVQAQCATRGTAGDPGALYLVELTDARGVLANRWFQYPTASFYNVRAPAYPSTDRGGTYYPASMNGGTTWTWDAMIGDLWGQMGALLGAYPGLPAGVTVSGTPEGFDFPGVSAWHALCDVLEHLGLTVAADLTQPLATGAPYTIVQSGAPDVTFSALQAKFALPTSQGGALEDDAEYLDAGAGRVPGTVKVMFRRRNQAYGTEETVTYRSDAMAQQWEMSPYHVVTVSAPTQFVAAGAVGVDVIWSDFTVRYDQNSKPVAADVVYAAQIAAERVSQYFGRVYRQTSGYMSQTYAGALPFTAGSLVDGVCWERYGNDYGGWRTRIVRGPQPPFAGVWGDAQ
jgi:hypothetical protein